MLKRSIGLALILACSFALKMEAAAPSMAQELSIAQKLSTYVDRVVEDTGFVGAVLVSRAGMTVFEGGWGFANREESVEFGPDTPVDAASLAKTFVAAGLWQLDFEGRIDILDPVRRYVPEFGDSSVTVLDLLRHSAGLADLDDPTFMTNAEIAAAVESQLLFAAGSRFQYCNQCFDILALVTERASGQRWADFLQERFFDPLGMSSAFQRPEFFADWPGVRTLSYRRASEGDVLFDTFDGERFYGSSNLMLSARDLMAWGRGYAQGTVLDDRTMKRGRERAWFTAGESSAMNDLNWFQATESGPVYFDGHLRGFHSVLYWDPDSLVVVAWVSNTLGGRPNEILFTRDLVNIANGADVEGAPKFPGDSMDEFEMEAVPGSYAVRGIGRVDISIEDGIAWISIDGAPAHAGYPATGFYVPDLGVEIGFQSVVDQRYQIIHWVSVFDVVAGRRKVPLRQ